MPDGDGEARRDTTTRCGRVHRRTGRARIGSAFSHEREPHQAGVLADDGPERTAVGKRHLALTARPAGPQTRRPRRARLRRAEAETRSVIRGWNAHRGEPDGAGRSRPPRRTAGVRPAPPPHDCHRQAGGGSLWGQAPSSIGSFARSWGAASGKRRTPFNSAGPGEGSLRSSRSMSVPCGPRRTTRPERSASDQLPSEASRLKPETGPRPA